jgi:hypothetical protein
LTQASKLAEVTSTIVRDDKVKDQKADEDVAKRKIEDKAEIKEIEAAAA